MARRLSEGFAAVDAYGRPVRTVELTTAEEAEEAADLLAWIWTTQRHMDPPVPVDGPDVGDRLDRVLVVWPTSGPAEPGDSVGPTDAPVVLDVSPDLAPVVAARSLDLAAGCSVATARIPLDVAALRRSDPALGRRWREAFSATCGVLLGEGWAMTGMTADGCYVLRRPV